jgi:glycosyltransferase involved in cell wall biosynthesis
MRILLWHVHGSWTTAFVQGRHEYVVPVTAERGADGLGRAATWTWPDSVIEKSPEELAGLELDAVVLQRPHELALTAAWTGRRPGRDLPAVYLEHNTPRDEVPDSRHPMAGQEAIPVVHVTWFNQLMWDCGYAPTLVVEHGVVDPGYRYRGDVPRAAVVVNDPVDRGRSVGTDLLPRFARGADLDIFGMRVSRLDPAGMRPPGSRLFEDLPQHRLHAELARRRVYLHTTRWTSLGLSLIEAMTIGMPVVALATTEARHAVPESAGVLSNDVDELVAALAAFVREPELARVAGKQARAVALERFGLARFLADWDAVLATITDASGTRQGVS